MRPPATESDIGRAIDDLVDRYRDRCLWFLRRDYHPTTRQARLRALESIQRHGDREAFTQAAELREWLSQHSSVGSADS
jgi:hypothetical protein